jgi:hypothetical protein
VSTLYVGFTDPARPWINRQDRDQAHPAHRIARIRRRSEGRALRHTMKGLVMHVIRNARLLRHTTLTATALSALLLILGTQPPVANAERPTVDGCSTTASSSAEDTPIDIERLVTTRKQQMAGYALAHARELG